MNVVLLNMVSGPTRSLGLKPEFITLKAAEPHSSRKRMLMVEVQTLASACFED